MSDKVIRWKQRFSNLESAFTLLSEAVSQKDTLSLLEKEGLVKRFEITFELVWKTLKDYLESEGVSAKFPREIIKLSFESGIIDDGEKWLEMLERRNNLVHLYDEQKFLATVDEITDIYHDAIEELVLWLKAKL